MPDHQVRRNVSGVRTEHRRRSGRKKVRGNVAVAMIDILGVQRRQPGQARAVASLLHLGDKGLQ